MSLDSKELDRSALESKDRDELVTIATALGTKPAARARKGTIVDLILELTGAVAPGSSTGSAAESGDASASGGEPAAAPARASASASSGSASSASTSSASTSAASTSSASGRSAQGRSNGGRASTRAEKPAGKAGETDKDTRSGADPDNGADPESDAGADRAAGEAAGESEPATADAGSSGRAGSGSGNRSGGQRSQRESEGATGDRNESRGDSREGDNRQRQRQDGANQNGANQNGDLDQGNRRRRRRSRSRENPVADLDEPWTGEPVDVEGYLDLRDDGYGFLRVKGFLPSKDDVYVSVKQVRQFGLRKGDHLTGSSRPASRTEKNPALLKIDLINSRDPEANKNRDKFEDLTPLFPDEKLRLEQAGDPTNMTARIVDLIAPIGKGQRGLIVSPPKAGKTTVMKTIAQSIEANNPEVHLIVLLVDERPEEVTDMRRSVNGDVVASTFDRPSDEHTAVAEMTIERAKRMVEEKKDVVIILDGITRLARAYNLAAPATGRIMSGGIDTGALYPPKRFFGAARNIEEGGSLTILATALVETGSKMDEVIFEEFKGTGNMELRLDRRMAERRIYPAIDVDASSTRHEELLFDRKQLQMVWKLRRVLSGLAADGDSGAGLEMLIDRLVTFKTNDDFLSEIAKSPGMAG